MKKALVIGGGLAGLSAAVYLSKNNFNVTLLEASPKLGGRTYSYFDKQLNLEIDNGQHIMMSCYKSTLDFVKIIGSKNKLSFENRLDLFFKNSELENVELKSRGIIYPLNLLAGLIFAKGITFKEKYLIKVFFMKLLFQNSNELKHLTVLQWLKKNNQTDNLINTFWSVLVLGTMNTIPANASAYTFFNVVKRVFLKGSNGYKMVIPEEGLSKIFCEPTEDFIKSQGGSVLKSERVEKIVVDSNKIAQVITKRSSYSGYDFYVSAIPYYALQNMIDIENINFQYSPIVTVHFKTDTSKFSRKHFAILNSLIQWVFVHKNHISCVTSNAVNLVNLDEEKIKIKFLEELEKHFPENKFDLEYVKVIKEKRATFVPSINIEKQRSVFSCSLDNLKIAGDWTISDLPSTIESAIISGTRAAKEILK